MPVYSKVFSYIFYIFNLSGQWIMNYSTLISSLFSASSSSVSQADTPPPTAAPAAASSSDLVLRKPWINLSRSYSLGSNALYSPEQLAHWARFLNNKIQFIQEVYEDIKQLATQEATVEQREMRAIVMNTRNIAIHYAVIHFCMEAFAGIELELAGFQVSISRTPFNASLSLLEKHGIQMTKLQNQADLISKIPELEQDPETSEEALEKARAAEAELIEQIQKHPNIAVVYESFQAFEAAYQALNLRQLKKYLHPDKYEYLKSLGYHPVFHDEAPVFHDEDQEIDLANKKTSVILHFVNTSAGQVLEREAALIEKQYSALKVLNTLARAHRSEAVPEGYQTIAEASDQDLRQDPYTQFMQRFLQVESFRVHTLFPYLSHHHQYSFYKEASKTWRCYWSAWISGSQH